MKVDTLILQRETPQPIFSYLAFTFVATLFFITLTTPLVFAPSTEPTPIEVLPNVFTYKGFNYDKIENHNTGLGVLTTHNDRLVDYMDWLGNPMYIDYRTSENGAMIQVETLRGSVVLDKNNCGFSFFNDGFIEPSETPLFTDSIIARKATDGTDIWNPVNQVNNAVCQTSLQVNGNTVELSAKKSKANVGDLTYKYIIENGSWHTELIANNNSTLNDQKFGFTQTIDLTTNTIFYGGQQRDLQNFNGTTFDRTWLENNKGKVLNLLNGKSFDFDLAFDNLWAVTVYSYADNTSKLTFDFTNNAQVLPSGATLILDPVFSDNTVTIDRFIFDQDNDGLCDGHTLGYSDNASVFIGMRESANNDDCYVGLFEWDVSGGGFSASSVIQSLDFLYESTFDGATANGETANIYEMDLQNSVTTVADAWTDSTDGTQYASGVLMMSVATNKEINLGAGAVSDFQTDVADGGRGWWGIIIRMTPETQSGVDEYFAIESVSGGSPTPAPTLQVTYTIPTQPLPPTSIATIALPNALNGSWSGCQSDGLTVNTCTAITGHSLWNATANHYAEHALPDNAGNDVEYPTVTDSVTMASTEILYHFDSVVGNETPDDSGNNNNATNTLGNFADDLIVFYNFDATQIDGITFIDQNNNINATNNGTDTGIDGIREQAIRFDGVGGGTEGVQLGFNPSDWSFLHYGDGNPDWTISWWLRDQTAGGDGGIIFDSSVEGTDAGLTVVSVLGGEMVIAIDNTVPSDVVLLTTSTTGDIFNDTNWHYYAITYDHALGSDNLKIYKDTILLDTGTKTANAPSNQDPECELTIGDRCGSASNEFEADYDDVAFADRVWSLDEIIRAYNNGLSIDLLNPIDVQSGLIRTALNTFPVNFTSTDTLAESTGDWSVGGLFNNTNSFDFNALAYNVTGNSLPTEIGANNSKMYVRVDGVDIASVDDTASANEWSHKLWDRSGTTIAFYLNGTLLGSNTTSTDLGLATSNDFFIGGDATESVNSLQGFLDEYYIKSVSDTSQANVIAQRGLTSLPWIQNNANQTFALVSGLNDNEETFYRIKLMNALFNGSTSNLLYGTTDNIPNAPTLSATPLSATNINFTSVAGASDGGDLVKDYGLRCELNGAGGWLTTVANSTLPANRSHNYGGLTSGDTVVCQWRDGNGVDWSPYSANATDSSYETTQGTVTVTSENIGDTFRFNSTVAITNASPTPVTVTLSALYQNGSLIDSRVESVSIAKGASDSIASWWHDESTSSLWNYTIRTTVTNTTGNVILESSGVELTTEFEPTYIPAMDSGLGGVNYTLNDDDLSARELHINRDTALTWTANCKKVTGVNDAGLEWKNHSGVGFINDTWSATGAQALYITCFNDEHQLFTLISYGNLTGILVGLAGLDAQLGTFFGLPLVFMFVLWTASLYTGNRAGMGLLITMIVVGVLSALGAFAFNENIWGILLTLTAIGLFAVKKYL